MTYADDLLASLDQAVRRAMSRGPMAIMFSGGLDSGVLAGLAKRHGSPSLFTVGIEGCHDLRMSEEAAAMLDLPWTPIVLSREEVIEACRKTLRIEPIEHPVVLSFELPLQIIASRVREPQLMSGQGADEMFGGYNRYQDMDEVERAKNMASDLEAVLKNGVPMDYRIAEHYGKTIAHPFLDPEVRRVASSIPSAEMIREGARKAPLRDVAAMLGLDVIAAREKKAAQYGSGFMKVMKAAARKEGIGLKEYVAALRTEQER